MRLINGKSSYRASALIVWVCGLATALICFLAWVSYGLDHHRWPLGERRLSIMRSFLPPHRHRPVTSDRAERAKRDEKESFNEIVRDLASPDVIKRCTAVADLGRTGRPDAIAFLGPALYEHASPHSEGDVGYASVGWIAADALNEIMPFTGLWLRLRFGNRIVLPEDWIQWWQENGSKYRKEGWSYQVLVTEQQAHAAAEKAQENHRPTSASAGAHGRRQ